MGAGGQLLAQSRLCLDHKENSGRRTAWECAGLCGAGLSGWNDGIQSQPSPSGLSNTHQLIQYLLTTYSILDLMGLIQGDGESINRFRKQSQIVTSAM